MKLFIKKIILFCFPIGVLILFPFVIAGVAGEFYSVRQVVKIQSSNIETLYLPAYIDATSAYKREAFRLSDSEIVAIGTSRVMQFRDYHFDGIGSFYNAGGIIHTVSDFEKAGDLIRLEKPLMVIVGVDPHLFRSEEQIGASEGDHSTTLDFLSSFLVSGWKNLYADILKGKVPLSEISEWLKDNDYIGMQARVYKSGFRNDGSMKSRSQFSRTELLQQLKVDSEKSILDINNGGGFEFTGSLSKQHLQYLDSFLAICASQNVLVIGFIPPYISSIREALLKTDLNANKVSEFSNVMDKMFSKYEYRFFDASNPASFGSSDEYLFDTVHASDVMVDRLVDYWKELNILGLLSVVK
jgi:hypothetical protein